MEIQSSPERVTIRDADPADLPAILAIYNDVILNTTAVYSETPVTLENRRAWVEERTSRGYPVLVACAGEDVLGFGSFGDFRAGACYGPTVEHSVHVRVDARGRGVGRLLMQALLARAAQLGKHVMVAGIDADNAASIRLHLELGFEETGHMREVGRKFGRWLDLKLLQKTLTPSA